jgi:hypothetical protein
MWATISAASGSIPPFILTSPPPLPPCWPTRTPVPPTGGGSPPRPACRYRGRSRRYPGAAWLPGVGTGDSATALVPVSLSEHSKAVGAEARRLAEALGITDPGLIAAVTDAGRLHDIGKADRRWQAMVGGTPGLAPLAKGPGGGSNPWRVLPQGWRHEMASVARLANTPALTRYLVGTHHGQGRPHFPAAPEIELWQGLGDWAGLRAQLIADHGYWGPGPVGSPGPPGGLAGQCRRAGGRASVMILTGLRPENPVAMMAAYGALRLLPGARLRWTETHPELDWEGDILAALAAQLPQRLGGPRTDGARRPQGQEHRRGGRLPGLGRDYPPMAGSPPTRAEGIDGIVGTDLLLLGGRHKFVEAARGDHGCPGQMSGCRQARRGPARTLAL